MGEQSEVGVCNWIGAAEGEEESGGGKSYQHPLLKLACAPVVLDNGEIYLKKNLRKERTAEPNYGLTG